jgi:hypothetical protein
MALKRFIFVAEGDAFMQIQFDDETSHPHAKAWVAGLLSNPTVIEVTNNPEVIPGWTWDGNSFNPPQ